jgi:hypothetical protein
VNLFKFKLAITYCSNLTVANCIELIVGKEHKEYTLFLLNFLICISLSFVHKTLCSYPIINSKQLELSNLKAGADPDRCQRCECTGQNWEIMLLEIIYKHIMLSSILSQALSNRIPLNLSSYQTANICLNLTPSQEYTI